MPAGRPRAFDIDKALDAAVGVFWQHGYDGTSIEALTEAMGINRPSLYAAFGDKADLFEKAVGRYGATRWTTMRAALETADDIDGAIARYVDAALRLVAGRSSPRGCLIACVLADAGGANPRWRALAAESLDAGRTAIAAAFERFLPPAKADRLALLLGMLTGGLAILARSGADAALLAEARGAAIAAARAAVDG